MWFGSKIQCFNFFPNTARRFPMQQTTFDNIVTKGEIAHNEQILILPQFFQLISIITFSINYKELS